VERRAFGYIEGRVTFTRFLASVEANLPLKSSVVLLLQFGPSTADAETARPLLPRRPARGQFAGVMTLVSTGTSLAVRPA
jgi:hypothetical protein